MAKLSVIEARKAQAVERLEAKLDLIMAKLGISLEQAPADPIPAVEEAPAEQAPAEPVAEQAPAESKSRKGK